MLRLLAVALVGTCALGSPALAETAPAQPLQTLPECVAVSTFARPGMGYDHLVTITNHCSRTALCQVSTNVNPQPVQASVPRDTSHTVLTYRGSPAREFVAKVSCSLQ